MKKNNDFRLEDFRLEDHKPTFEQELMLKIYTYGGSACAIMLMVVILVNSIWM